MSKKKKQTVTIISMIVVLAVICIAYFAVIKRNDKKEAAADTSVNLLQLDSASITGIKVTNENGELNFVRSEGKWSLTSNEEFIVSNEVMGLVLESLSNLNAVRQIADNNEGLEEFGLDKPAAVVVVTLSDGTTVTLSLGQSIPVAGMNAYYGMLEGTEGVYALSDYDTGIFFKGELDYKGESLQEFGEDESEQHRH
ncbi:MAG: DUF4340 domain-containing protein [Clostridium sp.]|nr:DUF4340 domain-containing protein [Clostridium sp.]